MVPRPSASAMVFAAVRVWPWVVVPLMVTEPVGSSLMLATADVALELTVSAVPPISVKLAVTLIVEPTSAWVRE